LPAEQEKVVTAKTTTVGLKEPMESRLDCIAGAYRSKIDRSAMWTVGGEQAYSGADHHTASAFTVLSAAGLA